MIFNLYLLILLFLIQIIVSKSLRCGHNCPLVFSTFNITIPENTCQQAVKDDAQCVLILELDFDRHAVDGTLMLMNSEGIDSLTIITEFGFNSTNTTITYRCSMSENCAWEFVNELFSPALVKFDALTIQSELKELLYINMSDPTEITCVNNNCSSESYCQAKLNRESLLYNISSINIDNYLSCVDASTEPDMIRIDQRFFPYQTEKTNWTLLCNYPQCNSNYTVLQAYKLVMNKFILPVNYSILNMTNITIITTTTPRSTASFSYFPLLNILILPINMFILILLLNIFE